MHFLNDELDTPALKLYNLGGAIRSDEWEEMRKPNDGTLNDVLVENAEMINTDRLLGYLVEQCGFLRIPNIRPTESAPNPNDIPYALRSNLENLGCVIISKNSSELSVATFRPDAKVAKLAATKSGITHIHFFAITPAEFRQLN